MKNEHGYCPHCGTDLDGESIWETFFNRFQTVGDWRSGTILPKKEAEIRADEVSKNYGASRTKGRWGRQIGIELDRDRIEFWECPDCNKRWKR